MSIKILTPEFRVSYPNVFKARAFDDAQEAKFSVIALFSAKTVKENPLFKKLMETAKAACIEEWGDKLPKFKHNPFRKHEEKCEKDEDGNFVKDSNGNLVFQVGMEAGGIFMTFSNKERPGVVDQNLQPILEASEFYAGCYARAHVNISPYDNKFGKGFSFYLNHIQKVRDGDPLGNRVRVEDAFTVIEGAAHSGNGAVATADDLFG